MIPGQTGSSGEEHGNPLQYSCLEKPMDRGAWEAMVHWQRFGHNCSNCAGTHTWKLECILTLCSTPNVCQVGTSGSIRLHWFLLMEESYSLWKTQVLNVYIYETTITKHQIHKCVISFKKLM